MGGQLNCQNSELDWFWVARIELLCQRKIAIVDGTKRDLKFIMLGDEGNHGHKTKTFFRHIRMKPPEMGNFLRSFFEPTKVNFAVEFR